MICVESTSENTHIPLYLSSLRSSIPTRASNSYSIWSRELRKSEGPLSVSTDKQSRAARSPGAPSEFGVGRLPKSV